MRDLVSVAVTWNRSQIFCSSGILPPKKYFIKIAGAKTVEAEISEQDSIDLLKDAVEKYKSIHHQNLIKYIDSFDINEFFAVIFEYADGECLFDHWNFEKYKNDSTLITPIQKFKKLENKKLPKEIDYSELSGLRIEARQKLNKIKPESVGQASRISGVSPADISVLLIYLEQLKRR